MIPETIKDLEKIEWGGYIEITKGARVLLGNYDDEIHMYYPNEMYIVSSIPEKYLTLPNDLIKELNNYMEKDFPIFEDRIFYVKYINRNKIINTICC